MDYGGLEEEDEISLMAHMERHETKRSDAWFLNFGCSHHMCASEGMFSSLTRPFPKMSSL